MWLLRPTYISIRSLVDNHSLSIFYQKTAYNRQLSRGHFSQILLYGVQQLYLAHLFFFNNLTIVLPSRHDISTYKIIFYSVTIWRSECRMGTVTPKIRSHSPIYDRASYSADFSHLDTLHQQLRFKKRHTLYADALFVTLGTEIVKAQVTNTTPLKVCSLWA